MERVVVLTGAGISAESGLATFRKEESSLWENERVEDVATPEAFARNPEKVHRFYNERRKRSLLAEPNAAHKALVRLEEALEHNFSLITQNVDDLHERAGSNSVIHIHGSLTQVFCIYCDIRITTKSDIGVSTICPTCKRSSSMRPDVVWFGEIPYHMDKADQLVSECSLFISIGTSGTVYPAAGFAMRARNSGARTVILNKESIDSGIFDQQIYGDATTIVPEWVDSFLAM